LKVHPDYLPDNVLAAVEQSLHEQFSFDARMFGQPVAASEVIAVAQRVQGVVAVDLDRINRMDAPQAPSAARLDAATPHANGALSPAELLTLDPGPVELGIML